MKNLQAIINLLRSGEFEFTRHALHRVVERNISDIEIIEAAKDARLIEDYPNDKYSPSCLILGFTNSKRPLHIQVSYADTTRVRIITLYEPDKDEWESFERRK